MERIVFIEWEDSRGSSGGWQWASGLIRNNYCRCHSIGFVVGETDESITLASNIADMKEDDIQVNGIMVIPKCCIKTMRDIKVKRV